MIEQITEPEFVYKEIRCQAIEINLDGLKIGWNKKIWEFTYQWINKRNFKKSATIWTMSDVTLDFGSGLVSCQYVVQFGLGSTFSNGLTNYLQKEIGIKNIRIAFVDFFEELWAPNCHIENEKVWTQVELYSWSPFLSATTSSPLKNTKTVAPTIKRSKSTKLKLVSNKKTPRTTNWD